MGHSPERKELIQDACWFVSKFAESSASYSTPHIYVSMLPSWPKEEPVATHYLSRMRGVAETRGITIAKHSLSLKSLSVRPQDRLFGAVRFIFDGIHTALASKCFCTQNPQKEQIEITTDQFTLSVKPIAFSPDCATAASACTDCRIRLWDLQHRYELRAIPTKSSVTAIAFSPNGMHLGAACGDHKIRLWDSRTGRRVLAPLVGHLGLITSIAFSPDGSRIASGSQDQTIRLWDLKGCNDRPICEPVLLLKHSSTVTSVAFSPDGMHIASGSKDRIVHLWALRNEGPTGSLDALLKHSSAVTSVTFSPNGQYVASCARSDIYVWKLRGDNPGQLSAQISEPRDATSVTFSPDGTHIVCGFEDSTLCVWDLKGTRNKVVLRTEADHSYAGPINSVAFSPSGTLVASASSHLMLCVLKMKTTLQLHTPFQTLNAVTGLFSSLANAVWGASPQRPPAATDSSTQESQHKSATGIGIPWLINEHGCIFDKHSNLLLWIPPDLRGLISGPQNVAGKFLQGASIQLSFENAMIGESWTGCYNSTELPVR